MSPSLNQALHQLAGSTYTTKLSQEESRMGRLLQENATDVAIIEELYLAALCRFPFKVEKVQLFGTSSLLNLSKYCYILLSVIMYRQF